MDGLTTSEPTSSVGVPQTPPVNMSDVFSGPCPSAESGNGTNLPPVVRVRRSICRNLGADTAPGSCAPPKAEASSSWTTAVVLILLLLVVGAGAWYAIGSGGKSVSAGFGSAPMSVPIRPPTPL